MMKLLLHLVQTFEAEHEVHKGSILEQLPHFLFVLSQYSFSVHSLHLFVEMSKK